MAMKTFSRRLIIGLIVAAIIAVPIWVVKHPDPVAVRIIKVERGLVEATVTNTRAGTIKSCQRARLAPQIGGQVSRLLVKEGDRVEKGQPLLELWNQDLAAQLSLARSEARATEALALESCLKAAVAQREYQRIASLQKKGLASEEDLDRTETTAKAGAAACEAATAKIEVSREQIAVATAAIDRTILKAPFTGIVAEIQGEPGEYVTPSPPGIPTPPAIDLLDAECLYVTAPIDEVDAPGVELCMAVRVTLDAFGDRKFDGNVRRIAPYVLELEKQARTVEVEVLLSDPQQSKGLLPGYSADVEIILDAREGALRIPTESLIEDNNVLIYHRESGRLEQRTIKTGLSNWRYTEVISGLNEGDQVVTSIEREGVEDGALATIEEASNGK
jgi:HlyD family secretion protein